ncbi:MAG: TIM barrel protein [Pirellulaceae bacterium]|nr:TIM barrel protein [Pirellulaceae bacterium]
MQRRTFLQTVTASATACIVNHAAHSQTLAASPKFAKWQPNYIVGSCMYGGVYLGDILPEVAKCGSNALDIWPKPHGNQREQLDGLGEERFLALLEKHKVRLGCITQYKLGPFGLQDEMRMAQRLGCSTIITGGEGPVGLKGAELKQAVAQFIEKLKPHLAVAEQTGVTIAIENHAKNLIDSADSLRYLAELSPSPHLAIAMAPYHLPQDTQLLSSLISELRDSLAMFYAWQHGDGCMVKLPKERELLQMPGRGTLDFAPLWKALASIEYAGWVEIFMHPVPRGIPILETPAEVTAEINRAKKYLDSLPT